jgi:predicted ATPase
MVDPSFHTGQISKLFLIINRMVRISIASGLGRSSGVAFALYGFSLSSDDGNRKENYRYGKLAEILQEKLMAREFDCRVLTFVYLLLNHWQEPLQKSLSPLLSAYRVGMEKGDIDYAFQGESRLCCGSERLFFALALLNPLFRLSLKLPGRI